jgi:amino acid transporter
MVYLKSLLAGVAAVVIAVVLSLVAMSLYVYITYKPKGDETFSLDLFSLTSRTNWLIAAMIFLVGFVWEVRRASK